MFRHVGQRLLDDAVAGEFHGARQPLVEAFVSEVDANPVPAFERARLPFDGRG